MEHVLQKEECTQKKSNNLFEILVLLFLDSIASIKPKQNTMQNEQ